MKRKILVSVVAAVAILNSKAQDVSVKALKKIIGHSLQP